MALSVTEMFQSKLSARNMSGFPSSWTSLLLNTVQTFVPLGE